MVSGTGLPSAVVRTSFFLNCVCLKKKCAGRVAQLKENPKLNPEQCVKLAKVLQEWPWFSKYQVKLLHGNF